MKTLSENTYERIRTRILEGSYTAGSRLREEDVAEELGVSRTPVREAVWRLFGEGLRQVHDNRSAEVVEYEHAELGEIFALRAILEGYGARMAACADPGPDLDALRNLADVMEAMLTQQRGVGGIWQEIAKLSNEFHRVILDSAGGDRLASAISPLVHMPIVHQTFRGDTPEGLARSFIHHRELITAIEAHDPGWAESVLQAHIFHCRAVLTADRRDEPAAYSGTPVL